MTQIQASDVAGLPALVAERTSGDWARITARLSEPGATSTRATYAGWLRHQAAAWSAVPLPAVPVAALDWPLASVRPQCLDVVGLIIADLRELSPRNRPPIVPPQGWRTETPPHGAVVGAALLCVRVAQLAAPLLGRALRLSAGITAAGSATRYLGRCADLAERAPGVQREVTNWAAKAGDSQVHHAVTTSQLFTRRLADAWEASTPSGW
jgi:hypothetical protein